MMALFNRDTLESWADNAEDNYNDYHSFNDLQNEVLLTFLRKFGLEDAWGIIRARLSQNWHQHLNNLREYN